MAWHAANLVFTWCKPLHTVNCSWVPGGQPPKHQQPIKTSQIIFWMKSPTVTTISQIKVKAEWQSKGCMNLEQNLWNKKKRCMRTDDERYQLWRSMIQTQERFKITLFIKTKHNVWVFRVFPFIKPQVFVLIDSVILNLLCVWILF